LHVWYFSLRAVLATQRWESEKDSDKINVYASFYTMYDFANKIGGDRINLVNIMPAGTEPHHWEPSPKDILEIEKADVFIYNGAGMELGWKRFWVL